MMKRNGLICVSVAALVSLLGACGGDATSAADGKKAAERARRPVAQSYWKIYRASGATGQVAFGRFTECTDRNAKNSSMYEIYAPIIEGDKKESDAEFLASLKSKLSAAGWDLRSSGKKAYSSTVHGVTLVIVPLKGEAGQGPRASLWTRSECIPVGNAKKELLHDYGSQSSDKYDPKDASASPVPTGFPDPDAP
ncbi:MULTISPECIES: hypothetical protein [unclassified Streptomyces]|uniref:hypothetical protein n=1 Tax=unclassified Streptomyces TaxID=2593676 RepID=UPI002E2453C9|nr:hypothetical protein OG217_10415 [Streptomyces sp. NBC_01023]